MSDRRVANHRVQEFFRGHSPDYLRTRVYHGLIDDAYGPGMILLIGADRVLWGSDFPHVRSIGLEAQEHVHRLLGALPHEEQAKVVGGSAAQVFNIA